jgi:hypothetical protein
LQNHPIELMMPGVSDGIGRNPLTLLPSCFKINHNIGMQPVRVFPCHEGPSPREVVPAWFFCDVRQEVGGCWMKISVREILLFIVWIPG